MSAQKAYWWENDPEERFCAWNNIGPTPQCCYVVRV